MFRFSLAPLLALLLVASGCSRSPASDESAQPLPHSHRFPLRVGDQSIEAQLAIAPREMERGLMGRTELGENEGMIFLYRQPIRASFWMKNTPLPLDIGYFNSDGILLEVHRLHPHDQTPVRSRSDRIQFALEMRQGWFSENRIRRGASLDRELLREAIGKRGFDPADYGL